MKKLAVIFSAIVLAVSCALFAACAGVEGTYKVKSLTINGTTYSIGQEFTDGETLSADTFVITIKKDGKITVSSTSSNGTYSMDGTWAKKSGDVYTLTLDNVSVDITIKNGSMTYSTQGMSYTMKKV